ncbi:hypothetical protein [Actinophytocola gossypii]|uniref:Guanylate cyclase domain-containing protein n=1 Tax=Actinophytocola gossypii TaxID=2812003 RepID=A0ABT2J999_9PSEU|nr:hypothetical protein [Actinophytocola gossypii]MCT2584447.1 hypothetical protein [Actinophytocola gossypii]
MTDRVGVAGAWDQSEVRSARRYVLHVRKSGDRVADRRAPAALVPDQVCAPVHRAIVALDIARSTVRADPVKARLRRRMYHILDEAMWSSGISGQHHDFPIDRGDGALVLIKPSDQVPKTILLARLMPALACFLADYNARYPHQAFQLRASVHAGEVNYDRWGPFGEALDIACRLLDAPELKNALAGSTAPLALVVSDDIYRSIVRHGYDQIDSEHFSPDVRVEVAGIPHLGWVRGSG